MNITIIKEDLDNEDSVGIGGGIVRDGIKPKDDYATCFKSVWDFFMIGIYICMNSSWTLPSLD